MAKIACVAVVRNEERHIAEWIAYQFVIGFDAVILLDNLSTDLTRARALAFAPVRDVRVLEAPYTGADFQALAYHAALTAFGAEFEWMAFFDADEFLVLDGGAGLHEVLGRLGGAAGVAVNWAMFGSAGHRERPAGLTIEAYQRRGAAGFHANAHVKSIVRPPLVRGYVNPHVFNLAGPYTDLKGRPVVWKTPGIIAGAADHAGGRLQHYFTRSAQDWAAKLERGYRDVTREAAQFGYYDRNEVPDDAAARLAPAVRAVLDERRPPPKKLAAVVLVVKDEASDIEAWLAWYDVLGFDACIVFDDDSTDGTWELLRRAAKVQDIRAMQAKGPREARFETRQEQSYRFALAEYSGEFEWLAFFDADEFLRLERDASIAGFLARFADADAVAVNWCNYGSSGHYLKPDALPVEAYTWHGNEREVVNRHVKSLVRPGRVGGRWLNVHSFDVDPERYAMSDGAQATWSATPGIIDRDPDWSVARLMHYQCRSMEHFLERLRKRPELRGQRNLWEAYDVRQVCDEAPGRLAPRVRARMAAYARPAPARHRNLIFDIGMSEGNDTAFYLAKGFAVVGVEPDVQAYLALRERFDSAISSGRLKIYNFAAAQSHGEMVEFFHHEQHQGISGLSCGRPEFVPGSYRRYPVLTINWAALVAAHGVPHYMKVDIEGHEVAFLRGLAGGRGGPEYLSVECYRLEVVEMLYELGYRRFKLVDQAPESFRLPAPQREGDEIAWTQWHHASGPFGRDLTGEWLDFEAFKAAWQAARPAQAVSWFDCHAWMPEIS
jgi:FkbM family methyltransferase